jgi:hypothetical protein
MNIMHTMASEARTQTPKRRFYSPELKLQVVGACTRPGASIAGVALQHGINTNIEDVLTKLPGHMNSRIEELLPHRWQPQS